MWTLADGTALAKVMTESWRAEGEEGEGGGDGNREITG